MNIKQARAWLRGERDMTKIIPQEPFDARDVRIAQADAYITMQAYYVLKAHAEGLMTEGE